MKTFHSDFKNSMTPNRKKAILNIIAKLLKTNDKENNL